MRRTSGFQATVSAKIPLHQLGPHSPLYGAGAQSYRQQCVQLADGWDSLTDGNSQLFSAENEMCNAAFLCLSVIHSTGVLAWPPIYATTGIVHLA